MLFYCLLTMPKKQQTIDEQLRRLEEIRQHLEKADRPIEDLLKLYEEGMTIAAEIRQQLQAIRQRIITLGEQLSSNNEQPPEEP